MRTPPWLGVPAALLAAPAYATSYLSIPEAQQLMFPGQALREDFVSLSAAQRAAIAARSGVEVGGGVVRQWRAADGGVFLVDEVIGKHERIGLALGINADGSVRQLEILDYREAYGFEVRNARWRQQFAGKRPADPVALGNDIRNISGATLSSRHVTDGVRRLLATYEIALRAR
jgi:Na+-translocating ferredoxin:NAD+ oxidoreductase RnfG subunit